MNSESDAFMPDRFKPLVKICEAATDGPWVEDDGYIHSVPATVAVTKYIDRLMSDPAYDAEQGGDQKDRPETVVALCDQDLPNFEADSVFISTFDKPMVLDMLGVLEQVGSLRDAWRAEVEGQSETAMLEETAVLFEKYNALLSRIGGDWSECGKCGAFFPKGGRCLNHDTPREGE